jgi:hypothetical protein
MKLAEETAEHTVGRRAETAEYIALEASRLARIANANQFALIAYLIDMVVLEAWREATEADSESAPARPSSIADRA